MESQNYFDPGVQKILILRIFECQTRDLDVLESLKIIDTISCKIIGHDYLTVPCPRDHLNSIFWISPSFDKLKIFGNVTVKSIVRSILEMDYEDGYKCVRTV